MTLNGYSKVAEKVTMVTESSVADCETIGFCIVNLVITSSTGCTEASLMAALIVYQMVLS